MRDQAFVIVGRRKTDTARTASRSEPIGTEVERVEREIRTA
jgi:hypothetical protein